MPICFIGPAILFQKPGDYADILRSAGFELRYPPAPNFPLSFDQLAACLDGVDAAIAADEPYNNAIFDRFPQLRVVSRAGVGYDSVDVESATRHGVLVGFAPGSNHEAVAEHTFAFILGVARRVLANHRAVIDGEFARLPCQPLRGRTLGIVGLGRIGRAVAVRAQAFGMRILVADPVPPTVPDEPYVTRCSLEQLYAESDYVSLHVPMSPETDRMIRKETIALMKPGVVIVNTSRGGLIDEDDLVDALKSGRVGAAALDVYRKEPPTNSPLRSAPNTLLAPHVAGVDHQSVRDMSAFAAEAIVDLYRGNWPTERLVNGAKLAGWKWKR